MVKTPVLFETFVRVEYARQVWEAIKAAQPQKLYFYSNKGRVEKEGEIERNNEIRSWVKEIDWDCEIHTFFREECVDVFTSLKGAISWLFDNEEAGIVLEDDCVPTPAFFSFCDQMIEKYQDNKKVWCISGDNYLSYKPQNADYFFSHYHFMYGWASWADRWKQIPWGNIPIDELMDLESLTHFYDSRREAKFRMKELKRERQRIQEKNCWDFAFGAVIDYNKGVTVQPKDLLVTCVGLVGTHSNGVVKTIFHQIANPSYEVYEINCHPAKVEADKVYDHSFFKIFEKHMRLYNRAYRKLYAYIMLKLGIS